VCPRGQTLRGSECALGAAAFWRAQPTGSDARGRSSERLDDIILSPGSCLVWFPQSHISYTNARLSAVALASLKP
jgi:hypothetical protein